MATDLFGKYFNNPTKSYVYTNLLCNGASADEISFDITKSEGVISDNENALSKIDLSGVHVPLSQYTRDMKIINPYGFIYVRGVDYGDSYTTKAFGVIDDKALAIEDWMYITTLIVHIKYVDNTGNKVLKCITASGSNIDEITFIEKFQTLLDEQKIPINISYKDKYVYFTSTVLGFEFWITDIETWHYTGDGNIEEEFPDIFGRGKEETTNNLGFGYDDGWSESSNGHHVQTFNADNTNAYTTQISESDYRAIYNMIGKNAVVNEDSETSSHINWEDYDTDTLFGRYLFEDLTKYVPAHKYRNGAMKGCVVVATYPIFNASDIPAVQRALKIGHLKDRVEEFYTSDENLHSGVPMYVRVVRDVVDSYFSQYEYDIYNKWSNSYTYINTNDEWIDPEEIPYVQYHDVKASEDWTHSHVPNYYMLNSVYKDAAKYEAIGLYGYATYLSRHNEWTVMGQLYARTTVDDDESTNTHNLIPSFIIYNPNSFPVTVNYMTFA